MSDLATIQAGWDEAARRDAMFNIVTLPERENGGWTAAEFFAHGDAEIDAAIWHLASIGVELSFHRALDFGCGVGRTTQALAKRFDTVDGVDISPEMVERAKWFNQHGPRCVYHVNATDDLAMFDDGTFDLVYTMIVLQHMPSQLARGYVQEFLRLLSPDGVAMFEIPPGSDLPHEHGWLSVWGTPREEVEGWVAEAGGTVLDVEPINEGSLRYVAMVA